MFDESRRQQSKQRANISKLVFIIKLLLITVHETENVIRMAAGKQKKKVFP